jgi:hypothetical protein
MLSYAGRAPDSQKLWASGAPFLSLESGGNASALAAPRVQAEPLELAFRGSLDSRDVREEVLGATRGIVLPTDPRRWLFGRLSGVSPTLPTTTPEPSRRTALLEMARQLRTLHIKGAGYRFSDAFQPCSGLRESWIPGVRITEPHSSPDASWTTVRSCVAE